jgi:hypothetical protein
MITHASKLLLLWSMLSTLLVTVSSAYAVSITFSPPGAQLDADPILDILAAPGQQIQFSTRFDAIGIGVTNAAVAVGYEMVFDPTELEFLNAFTQNGIPFLVNTIFAVQPGLIKFTHSGGVVAGGALPVPLSLLTLRVLPGLVNDGVADLSIQNPEMILSIGGPPAITTNEVSVQPVPEPLTLLLFSIGAVAVITAARNRQR